MNYNQIVRIIERNQTHLKELKDNQDKLSVWGYRDMGYYEGRISVLEDLLDEIKSKDIEIEKLQNALAISQKETRRYAQRWPEAIKEFAKRLKEYLDDFYHTDEDAILETSDLIDDLVKEMVGENNG